MQLEDGNTAMFFTLFIDLSTAVHRSEGFRCVSQIPLKSTPIYSYLAIYCYPFSPHGPRHDTQVHTSIFQTLCLCNWVNKEMVS